MWKACIIGSFRKHYDDIAKAIQTLESSGCIVLSPRASTIIRDEEGFVILATDRDDYSHIEIQSLVFHRAFHSDFVYVWNPEGYVGKTTCYEIGRIIEHHIPVYFKEQPDDVPIYVKDGSIIELDALCDCLRVNKTLPVVKYSAEEDSHGIIRDLEMGIYYE